MILAVKFAMTAATLCFAIGYAARHRNNRLHRRFMPAGFALAMVTAALWIAGAQAFGSTYRPVYWLVRGMDGPERAHWMLVAHWTLGGVALAALGAQVYFGMRRHPLHLRVYPLVIALWLTTYISGMFLFA